MVGLNKVISIVKFRTMVRDAKSEKYGLEKKYMKEISEKILLSKELQVSCLRASQYINDNYDKISKEGINHLQMDSVISKTDNYLTSSKIKFKKINESVQFSIVRIQLSAMRKYG